MKAKVAAGLIVAGVLFAALAGAALSNDWELMGDYAQAQDFGPGEDGELSEGSLNWTLYETYGPLLLVLAVLMFGAIIAGVAISKEEEDSDDSD